MPPKGQAVFEEKSCAGCHDTDIGQRRPGPPISTWTKSNDPLSWAERMWNHSKTVYAEVWRMTVWPGRSFSTNEMVDMLSLSPHASRIALQANFQPGNLKKGRMTFEGTLRILPFVRNRTTAPKIDLLKHPLTLR